VRLKTGPFTNDWKIIPLKCTEAYKPEVLLKEVLSWIQKDFGIVLNEEALEYWHIWDDDGQVDPTAIREPIDGKRFAILLQLPGEDTDVEEDLDSRDKKDPIFILSKQSKWRCLKSQYKVEIVEPVILLAEPEPPPPEIQDHASVAERRSNGFR
jgi:hypothetical protein